MIDFEMHPHGTSNEIRASRALAREIEKQMQEDPSIIPVGIMNAYLKLFKEYSRQIQSEIL